MENPGATERKGGEGAPSPSPLDRLSDMVNVWCERVLFALMVAMIFFTTLQVVCRVFFTALSWTEEITCFLLFYATLFGTAVGFKRGSHIAMTFLLQALPAPVRKALSVGILVGGIVFFSVMAYYGGLLGRTEAAQITPGLQISMTWIYSAFPLLGAVVILHLLAGIRRVFTED